MSLIIKQSYFAVLNSINNFTSNVILTAPYYNVKRCRILSNYQTLINCNFIQDSYTFDTTNGLVRRSGICVCGDPMIWYETRSDTIVNPVVSIFDQGTFVQDNLQLVFQFVED
jgi:hypothetical protein